MRHEVVLRHLDRCKLLKWHGLHGESLKGLLDGVAFQMDASVNDRVIYADGFESFLYDHPSPMNGICRLPEESEESARD